MTRSLILCVSLLLLTCIHAQVLDSANTHPVVGEVYYTSRGSGPSMGAAGDGVVWDMSGLITVEHDSIVFDDPTTAAWHNQYDNPTAVEFEPPGTYFYHRGSSSTYDFLGRVNSGSITMCPNGWAIYAFPTAYGSTWSDTFLCYDFGGERMGTTHCTVDGRGTLIMPYGTLTNVLRMVTIDSITVAPAFVDPFLMVDTTVRFMLPGTHVPILEGRPNGSDYTWVEDLTSAVDEWERPDMHWSVAPNPADGIAVITYQSGSANLELTITALDGSIAQKTTLAAAPSLRQQTIDVSSLSAGIYVLRLLGESGTTGSTRLVIH
ncbi:MAG: T9SS type A sorting domain-containing protein [Flavobacteriales bacterium]|nr:T9SS type A sorting domain-containing protein [Flavobacteriales bacterium]